MKSSNDNPIKYNLYEDYPEKGVNFIDFTPMYYDIKSRNFVINEFSKIIDNMDIDFNNTVVVAPDARGFLLGSIIADRYDLPLVLVRKESKFPPESIAIAAKYKTEYSEDCLAIQNVDLNMKKCIFIDDVFATGGTFKTVKELCILQGAIEVIPLVIYDVGISENKNVYYLFNSHCL